MSKLLSLIFICVVLNINSVSSEIQEGDVNLLKTGWAFLGHFMIGTRGTDKNWQKSKNYAGTIQMSLHLHNPHALKTSVQYTIALYDDQATSWPKLHASKNHFSAMCNGTELNVNLVRETNHVTFDPSNTNTSWEGHNETIQVHEHITARWWWAYIVNCDYKNSDVQNFLHHDIAYSLHWTQNDVFWNAELSMNDRYQNTLNTCAPWIYFLFLIMQCSSYYFSYSRNQSHFVHVIIRLLTLMLIMQWISSIFTMSYWLHLTYSGFKEFAIDFFAFLFAIFANVIFLYILLAVLAFGWRMSVAKLSKLQMRCILMFCVSVQIFEMIMYIWSDFSYPNKESTLYRYSETPQVIYGVFMFLSGILFYGICVFYSFHDSIAGITTSSQRNFRLICGAVLFVSWFLWPLIAVAATETYAIHRADFACDSISFVMRAFSFLLMVCVTHPINFYSVRWFDFNKQFVHARYVKNTGNALNLHDPDDDSDDSNNDQAEMTEIKAVVKPRKKQKKKKKLKFSKQKKNMQYIRDESDDSDDSSGDSDAGAGGVSVTAVTVDGAREDTMPT